MSTRCTIIYTAGTHIYEETVKRKDGEFYICWSAYWEEYKDVQIVGDILLIKTRSSVEVKLSLKDLEEIEFDSDGFAFYVIPNTDAYEIIKQLKEKTTLLLK